MLNKMRFIIQSHDNWLCTKSFHKTKIWLYKTLIVVKCGLYFTRSFITFSLSLKDKTFLKLSSDPVNVNTIPCKIDIGSLVAAEANS